jgi:uncharacterized protein (DUF1800 family)
VLAVAAMLLTGPALSATTALDAPGAWTDDSSPITEADWNRERAAHLLERAGFGGTPEEVDRLAAMTPREAVRHLVYYQAIDPSGLGPFEHSGIWDAPMQADLDLHLRFDGVMKKAAAVGEVYGVERAESGPRPLQDITDALYYKYLSSNREWLRVATWWAERMLTTPRPLEEKMTLLWHGHFATEELKVDDYRLMLRQNETLRELATGNVRDLLIAMSRDPAMLLYLDNRLNVRAEPNENYAREILELFSLGIGNYTEQDIKEAARALTGWRNQGLRFIDDEEQHDPGEKTIFGKTGRWDGEDLVDLILEEEACAEFLAGKIYRFLVREDLSPTHRAELAAVLRESDYEIAPLLEHILMSRDFYSEASVATQIKSPVQFLVSTYRKLGLKRLPGVPNFTQATALLGQSLGNPPNVKGWDGGRTWLNPSTLLARNNIVRHLLFPETAAGRYPQNALSPRLTNAPREAEQRDRRDQATLAKALENDPSLAIATPASEGDDGSMAEASMGDAGPGSSMMGDAPSAARHNSFAEYDLKLGLYNGLIKTYERVRAVPPIPAPLDLVDVLRSEQIEDSLSAVVYFEGRFLRHPLREQDRQAVAEFLESHFDDGFSLDTDDPDQAETALRETLHMVLSMPEYQLAGLGPYPTRDPLEEQAA